MVIYWINAFGSLPNFEESKRIDLIYPCSKDSLGVFYLFKEIMHYYKPNTL